MKRILIQLIGFLTIIYQGNIFSQYDSMIVESKIWHEVSISYDFSGNLYGMHTIIYKFSGDTSFNDKSYKILYEYSDSAMTYYHIVGFWREDSLKVYQYIWDKEYLRYDFSLEKGDTVCIYPYENCSYPDPLRIEDVDTVEINGKRRKRIFFNYNHDVWIEGIGSTMHPFEPLIELIDAGQALLCCKKNDTLLYQDLQFDDCYVYYLTKIDVTSYDNSQISIYPNPFKFSTNVHLEGIIPSEIKNINFLNAQGQIISEIKVTDIIFTLERQDFPSGLYFIQVIDNKNNILVEKVLIE